MCGISGILNFNPTAPVDRGVLERMTFAQAHRGPDDSGYFIDVNVGLGHRRLSIIDLSGGRQPMFNEDGSVAVVFNGEIYNYAELTDALAAKGHRFVTRSDTEAIVHSYEEYGESCMRDFRGMFAFAIWDRRARRLFLVRDRLGIKPLYYYAGRECFVFASEIKSLLEHPQVPREVEREAVDQYLALRYVPGPATMFRNVYKLQPGHWLSVDSRSVRIEKYWDLPQTANSGVSHGFAGNDVEVAAEFRKLLEDSVRSRLIAEVPLGVFLSGGLDSSAVLAVMSRITGGERVKTFSVGYEARGPQESAIEEANEFTFAREAASRFGADHHEFRLKAGEFRDAIPAMVFHLDEPMADPTCIPLYFLSKLARQYITVVLSGEGADETMGGYTLYRKLLVLDRMRRCAGPFAAAFPLLAALPVGSRARAYLRRAALTIDEQYRGVGKGVSLESRLALTGPGRVRQAHARMDEAFGAYFKRSAPASTLSRMLYADAKVWLPEDLLLKADKMTMAASLELRVPFLDHKLAEYAARLPDHMKIRGNTGKWILREAIGSELPPRILHRTKKGFPVPAEAWFRTELRGFVRETLLARDSACREFFEPKALESILDLQERGKFPGHQEVWSLLVFEFWHNQFIRRRAFVAPELQSEVRSCRAM